MASEREVIVMGGSLAGLLAARVLSDHFEKVTIIERDKVHDRPETRKGQPQTRHVHALLASGLEVMTRYFPDLPDGLGAGGAILTDMGLRTRWFAAGGYRLQFESGLTAALVSRAFLEWQIRRRVLGLPNVSVLDQCTVNGLLTSKDNKRVTGVRTHRMEESEADLTAELVIDTTGRGSPTPKWLEALGYNSPVEDSVTVGVGYTTRVYRRRPGDLTGADCIMIGPHPPHNKRSGFFFPWEDNRWTLTLAGNAGDHCPPNEADFANFARSLAAPDIANAIHKIEPLTDFITHGFPSNLRRRYEKLGRFPEGYLVMGDAICSFNPIYGQGMTSAALQTAALDEVLQSAPENLAEVFFHRAAGIVDMAWQLAIGEDFRFPETTGKKPRGLEFINAYVSKVQRATHRDPVVYKAFLDVMNLASPATSLFRPRIMWRVLRSGGKVVARNHDQQASGIDGEAG